MQGKSIDRIQKWGAKALCIETEDPEVIRVVDYEHMMANKRGERGESYPDSFAATGDLRRFLTDHESAEPYGEASWVVTLEAK